MMHGCRWVESLLAVLILAFTIWPTQILSAKVSMWIVVISAALILVHSLFCGNCEGICMPKKGRKK
jgi:hypothetical protein